MKEVELSDAARAALADDARHVLAGDSLLVYLNGEAFSRKQGATERYLDLLAWCARNYPSDFSDFIAHQASGRRYLGWSGEEINEARAHNQARPIEGTPYWAVMAIDDDTRRRFVCRLLEFIGCHDETVTLACRALDLATPTAHWFQRLSA